MPKTYILIPAGGSGTRFGGATKKQFLELGGRSILEITVERFLNRLDVAKVVVAMPADDLATWQKLLASDRCQVVGGGSSRAESVQFAFRSLVGIQENDIVLIHDAVRPLVSNSLIDRVILATKAHQAALPVLAIADTIKLIADDKIAGTIDRNTLGAAQTPQGLTVKLLQEAYQHFGTDLASYTDEMMLAEACGVKPSVVAGERENLKITTPFDLALARMLGGDSSMSTDFRIGSGYDVHRYDKSRPCVIGGVVFDGEIGLLGHSDADVLLHAVCDAILGALALGDLGDHFPDTDPRYKNADSKLLLAECLNLAKQRGFWVNNVDATIIGEQPKIKPRRQAVRESLAKILNVELDRVSVKATTEEGLGYTGRREGLKAEAIVSLVKS